MAREALEQPGLIGRVLRTMPLRQLARAGDIAQSALFLASPRAARHLSGQVITVAGGMEGRILWENGQIDEAAVRRRAQEE
jgi:3-oxoacyl-[acyl-carrier protein] reductase